jgi:hypothetical protein
MNDCLPFIIEQDFRNKLKSEYFYYLTSPLVTNLALIGSFLAALITTFSANSGSSPVNSKRIFHLLTGVPYSSTSDFPDPIGISRPFFVIGVSGNTLIQSCPVFLVCLTITFLAASICLAVITPLSVAFKP